MFSNLSDTVVRAKKKKKTRKVNVKIGVFAR